MRLLRSLLRAARPMLGLAGGLVLVGLSGYAFTVAAAQVYLIPDPHSSRAADATAHAYCTVAGSFCSTAETAVTAYYFLVTTILLGVYNGLDQVTNRRVAHTLATGAPLRPALLRAVRDGGGLTAAIGALLLIASPVLLPHTLKGQVGLLAALFAGIVFAAIASVVRGVLAGSQRFGAYGMVWGAEGIARLLLIVLVVVSGTHSPWAFGFAYVLPYLISALVGLVACRDLRHAIQKPSGDEMEEELAGPATSMGLIALSTAGLLTTAVANLPQLVLTSRSTSGDIAIAAFGQAFLLARIALTVLTPFQSMLLPAFTHEAAVGNITALRRRLRSASLICAGVGALWALAMTVAGPWAVETVYSKPASAVPSTLTFLALGSGTILFAVASAVQPAIVAVGRYRDVPAIWACGVAATLAGAFWPGLSLIDAAVAAALAGPAAVLAAMAFSVRMGIPGTGPETSQDPAGVVALPERDSAVTEATATQRSTL